MDNFDLVKVLLELPVVEKSVWERVVGLVECARTSIVSGWGSDMMS